MAATTIEWTEATWNPVTGCSKISAGCANCYAERMAKRLRAMGQPNYANGFEVTLHPHMLDVPLRWRKPQMIFVNSMSDLFHEDVPADFIQSVFGIMAQATHHRFQVLTKRSERLREMAPSLPWPANVWIGVTVEATDYLQRVDDLREVPAALRFLSLEPLLGPLPKINLRGVGWVIAGGESGPGARVMRPEWVTEIRDQCLNNAVPFFFKQWGGPFKKRAGRTLEGAIWDEMPRGQYAYA